MKKLVIAAIGFALAVGSACGDGEPATTGPTGTTTPTLVAPMVPEGWERHITANFQIDLPETWEAQDLTVLPFEVLLEAVSLDFRWAALIEQFQPESFPFFAIDAESEEKITNLSIMLRDDPIPTTISALIGGTEDLFRGTGIQVPATDSGLTIGGLEAGSMRASAPTGFFRSELVNYFVQLSPTVVYSLVFATGADEFPALEPVFEQIAESFRVLDSP